MFSSFELHRIEAKNNTVLPKAMINIIVEHITTTDFKHATNENWFPLVFL